MNHCMVQAFARAFNVTEDVLIYRLGHDGTAVFPNTTTERSHHVQEMIDAAPKGYFLQPIELMPMSTDGNLRYPVGAVEKNFDRFKWYLNETTSGVILGQRESGIGHAVFFNGQCHDSRGSWKLWEDGTDFIPSVLWQVIWVS